MTELEEIKDVVYSHYNLYGAYPFEVGTSKKIYTWDEYWSLLDEEDKDA